MRRSSPKALARVRQEKRQARCPHRVHRYGAERETRRLLWWEGEGGKSLSNVFEGKQHSTVCRLPSHRLRQREQVGGKVYESKASCLGDRPLLPAWPCPRKIGWGGGAQGSSSPRATHHCHGAAQDVRRYLRVRHLLRLLGHGLHRDGPGVGPSRQGNRADRPWPRHPLQRCLIGGSGILSIGQHVGFVVDDVPLGLWAFRAVNGRVIRWWQSGTKIVDSIVCDAIQE